MKNQNSLNCNTSDLLHGKQFSKKVAILLGSYNGAKYLEEQLISISNQTYKNWDLYVCDDCSSDESYSLLEKFASENPSRVHLKQNKSNRGVGRNFLSLVLDEKISGDFFAFSDQDDYWYPDKLERAVKHLSKEPGDQPVVYGSRTEIVDKKKNNIGFSPLFKKKPCFKNALVQSIVGGNTMVFNKKARNLIQKVSKNVNVTDHDWWIQIVVTGCGGRLFYDPQPSLQYRQHGKNVTGSNHDWSARLIRAFSLLQGKFKILNDKNTESLKKSEELLIQENRWIFDQFYKARKSSLFKRCYGIWRSGVFRQTFFDNMALFVATVFGKV